MRQAPRAARLRRLGLAAALLSLALMGQTITPTPTPPPPRPTPPPFLRVSVGPPSFTVPTGETATLRFTWRLTTNVPNATATSPAGALVIPRSSTPLLTGGALSGSRGQLAFPESLLIPPDVLRQARDRRAARMAYVRTFTVLVQNAQGVFVPLSARAAVAIDLTTPLGGPLDVFRVALRFDEGQVRRLVRPGEPVVVWADLSYTGTGQIEATWELAEPASTAGAPIFRPLRDLRRFLASGQRVSIRAPELPTREVGIHLVRLSIVSPATDFAEPVLRYDVMRPAAARTQPRPLRLRGPDHFATLGDQTTFAWQPVAEAHAYQLEFYEHVPAPYEAPLFEERNPRFKDAQGPGATEEVFESAPTPDPELIEPPAPGASPAAGMIVFGGDTSARLSPLTLRKLEAGRTYVWRVRALDDEGGFLGESRFRALRIPPE